MQIRKTITKLLVLIQICLYITFLYIDIFNTKFHYLSTKFKYLSIIICFLITLIHQKKNNPKDLILLRLGLFFTVIADLFLLVYNYPAIGVSIFCIVQIFYTIRYNFTKEIKALKIRIIIVFAIFVIYIILNIFIFQEKLEIIIPITLLYFILIFLNTIKSIINLKSKKLENYLIACGMILFILCDINVGLYNITEYMSIGLPKFLEDFSSIAMWLFYLPSQVLLSISYKSLE